MQRYFCNELHEKSFTLNMDDSFHILKVMRMKLNDLIEVVYEEKVYICSIMSFNPVKALIKEEKDEYNELDTHVIICQSLVNEQKMDFILQKSTELGMYSFYPVKTLNSVIKDNGKGDKKILRWQRIVKEASEQSKRNIIPKVNNISDLKDIINLKADLKLLCSVNELTLNIKKVLQNISKCATIIIVIGPEGGFKPSEEKLLIDNGFISISLGKRVLRTETASLEVLSMINYEWMVE